ncbi:putative dienelactone hydrolase [Pseudomonas amygdali pv. ulmi]|uniref:Putative dienelactone hydrolase n=1 Tax=Pseudomonas amygdali pv. ulmi TaxID=251720 RepID=A0A3M4T1E6_PSEA0|nr:putative dienelactone hydrolase [Pseudomonas amygdali pv. ulmi]
MNGRYVSVNAHDGRQFQAYLATAIGGSGPGVVLCQEIFGVNQAMRDVADFLAEEGYSVLVPDLYWRQKPGVELGYSEEDFQQAFGFYQAFDERAGVDDIRASLQPCANCRNAPAVLKGWWVIAWAASWRIWPPAAYPRWRVQLAITGLA